MKKLILALIVLGVAPASFAAVSVNVGCNIAPDADVEEVDGLKLSGLRTTQEGGVNYIEVQSAPTDGREIINVVKYQISKIELVKGKLKVTGIDSNGRTTGTSPKAVVTVGSFVANTNPTGEEKSVKSTLVLIPGSRRVQPVVGKEYPVLCNVTLAK